MYITLCTPKSATAWILTGVEELVHVCTSMRWQEMISKPEASAKWIKGTKGAMRGEGGADTPPGPEAPPSPLMAPLCISMPYMCTSHVRQSKLKTMWRITDLSPMVLQLPCREPKSHTEPAGPGRSTSGLTCFICMHVKDKLGTLLLPLAHPRLSFHLPPTMLLHDCTIQHLQRTHPVLKRHSCPEALIFLACGPEPIGPRSDMLLWHHKSFP